MHFLIKLFYFIMYLLYMVHVLDLYFLVGFGSGARGENFYESSLDLFAEIIPEALIYLSSVNLFSYWF